MQSPRGAHLGEDLFLGAVGLFLLAYVVGLARTHTIEWAVLVSTVVLVIAVTAGLLVTRVIAPAAIDGTTDDAATGKTVDLRLEGDEPGHNAQVGGDHGAS